MNTKTSIKEAIKALKPNEPYKTNKETKATTALVFSPPPTEIKNISDQKTKPIPERIGFNIWQFVPEGRKVDLVEKDGNFHIPHKIYEFVHKVIENKMEILVFGCLLRYSLGFHRSTASASQSFMSRWTGIAPPNIRKALKSLREQGFIELVSEGTAEHNWATYELPIVKAYLEYQNSISAKKDLSSNQGDSSDKKDLRTEINSISNKEIQNKHKNKTLSQEMTDYVQSYFASAMTKAKRESEFQDFHEIAKQYAPQDVSDCLKLVIEKGVLKTGEHCHSPFRYLSKAMQDVMVEVEKVRKLQRIKVQEIRKEIEEKKQREAQELAEQNLEKEAFAAFEKQFVSLVEQESFVSAEINKKYPGPGTPKSLARKWVIVEWFNSQGGGSYADQGIR